MTASELVIDLFAVLLKICPSTGDKPLGLNRGPIDGRRQPTSPFQVGSTPPLGVSVNLGLPFIRTSVDHGTAFDIAGKGIADATSMLESIRVAVSIASDNRLPPV